MENNKIMCINKNDDTIINMKLISKFFIEGEGQPKIK